MKKFGLKHIFLILNILYFLPTIFWLVFSILDIQYGLYSLILIGYLGFSFYKAKNRFGLELNLKRQILLVLIICLDLLQVYFLDLNILSALFFVLSLNLFLEFKKSELSNYYLRILSFFTIPFYGYLNILFGIYLRKLYASLIFVFLKPLSSNLVLDGTMLVSNNLSVHIDNGCSGVVTMFFIVLFALVVAYEKQLKSSIVVKSMLLSFATYFVLNFFQLVGLVYSHNILGYTDLDFIHSVFANILSLVGIVSFLVYVNLLNEK